MIQYLFSKPFVIVLFNYLVGFLALAYDSIHALVESVFDVSESGILNVLDTIAPATGFFSFLIGTAVGFFAIRNLHLKNRNELIKKKMLERQLQDLNERED